MIHTRSRSDGLEWRSSSTKARGITQVRGEAGAADAKTQDLHVGLKQQPGRNLLPPQVDLLALRDGRGRPDSTRTQRRRRVTRSVKEEARSDRIRPNTHTWALSEDEPAHPCKCAFARV